MKIIVDKNRQVSCGETEDKAIAHRIRNLQADRDVLLKALKEMKAFGRIKYGNLNQDFNNAWERANTAIKQAEKEG